MRKSLQVRWCLDYMGLPYEEEQDMGVLGNQRLFSISQISTFFPTGRFILGRSVPVLKIPTREISLSNSSDILRYLYGAYGHQSKEMRTFLVTFFKRHNHFP